MRVKIDGFKNQHKTKFKFWIFVYLTYKIRKTFEKLFVQNKEQKSKLALNASQR